MAFRAHLTQPQLPSTCRLCRRLKQVMREQYGKLFAGSPGLHLAIANRMTTGEFVVDEEHVSGMHVGDLPAEMTGLSIYRVADGKIARLMLLF